jgi:uncharacterized membrane protein
MPPETLPDQMSSAQFQVTLETALPPPAILEGYNRVVADAGERFMALMETQAHHRMELETRTLEANIEITRNDQRQRSINALYAFILAVLLVGLCVLIVVVTKNGFAGGATFVASLAGVIIAFLTGRNQNRNPA